MTHLLQRMYSFEGLDIYILASLFQQSIPKHPDLQVMQAKNIEVKSVILNV
jgi:hypothetical protein